MVQSLLVSLVFIENETHFDFFFSSHLFSHLTKKICQHFLSSFFYLILFDGTTAVLTSVKDKWILLSYFYLESDFKRFRCYSSSATPSNSFILMKWNFDCNVSLSSDLKFYNAKWLEAHDPKQSESHVPMELKFQSHDPL